MYWLEYNGALPILWRDVLNLEFVFVMTVPKNVLSAVIITIFVIILGNHCTFML